MGHLLLIHVLTAGPFPPAVLRLANRTFFQRRPPGFELQKDLEVNLKREDIGLYMVALEA